MIAEFRDYFRCPDSAAAPLRCSAADGEPGFFRFGDQGAGYAPAQGPAPDFSDAAPDLLPLCHVAQGAVDVPFDASAAIRNLREERYLPDHARGVSGGLVRTLYYAVRPLLPTGIRKHLQRRALRNWNSIPFPRWPVDVSVDALMRELMVLALRANGGEPIPFVWFWPDAHRAAMFLSHDVETATGRDFCSTLMDLTAEFGFRSSFQVVPEVRYEVHDAFRQEVTARGFDLNLHGLNHDGHLFDSHEEFTRRRDRMKYYVQEWKVRGFRSPVLYRNSNWMHELPFDYDMTYPNVAHLDPQRGGCCTVMPFSFGRVIELPLTTTQDYTLFNIFSDYTLDLWNRQMDAILEYNGLISLNIHPDYVTDARPREVYRQLLDRLRTVAVERNIWRAKPSEAADWWRARSVMQVIREPNGSWTVSGDPSGRAQVAIARLNREKLDIEFLPGTATPLRGQV